MRYHPLIKLFVALIFCFFVSSPLRAQILQIQSGTYTAPIGFYVGPMTGQLDGVPITFYCDDFDHEVTLGESWQVAENTFQDIPQTRWHNLRIYENDAFLIEQMSSNIGDIASIQEAIWREESSNTVLDNAGSDYWFNLAAAQDFTHTDFSSFVILTPTDPNNYQEMIEIVPRTVPEPSDFLLATFGLGLMAWVVRRKKLTA